MQIIELQTKKEHINLKEQRTMLNFRGNKWAMMALYGSPE